MRAFKVFIFGLLYGWFIKIAFDRIYRENEMEDIRNENSTLQEYIHSLERQLASRPSQGEPARLSGESEPTELPEAMPPNRAPAEPFDAPAEALARATRTPSPGVTEGERDDLKVIKGIGPAIERKLNGAGIYTFAALARLSPKQLEEILGSQIRRLQDENDVILQAVRLSQNIPDEE